MGEDIKAYFQELDRLGYIEGKNLIVEWYSVLGRHDRTEEIARAVVASRPDLILAMSGGLTRALKPLTATIPILAITGDPVAGGIVTSLARPGGNITGVSTDAGLEIYGKRLQYLVETARRLANVRFLMIQLRAGCGKRRLSTRYVTPQAGPVSQSTLHWSARLSIKLHMSRFSRRWRETALTVLSSADAGDHLAYRQLIADLAARYRLPAIYPFREFVDAGGLLSYGIDLVDLFRRLAVMTNEVLRGAKPDDIPYYQMTKFDLVLNRATARSLGLDFPPTLLATANDVIE